MSAPSASKTGFNCTDAGATDARTTRAVQDKLADGGTVTMPLDNAPWGGLFGMVVDRFGVAWMLNGDPE